VASLGLVSPGAAPEGVTPIFFLNKTDALFSHHNLSHFCSVAPIYFLLENWRHFFSSLSLLLISLGVVTPWRVSPRTFLPVRLRLFILCKFAHKKYFFFRVSPPLRGRSAPPPSDTTAAAPVLHDGDVVSRSHGFGTTAARTIVSRTTSIFLDESVKAGSEPSLLWEFLYQTLWAPQLFKTATFFIMTLSSLEIFPF